MYFVYIVECADGTFYTGYAANLKDRVSKHNKGIASKYTRGRLPVKLVYWEIFGSKSDALRREYEIKQLSKDDKIRIVSGNFK